MKIKTFKSFKINEVDEQKNESTKEEIKTGIEKKEVKSKKFSDYEKSLKIIEVNKEKLKLIQDELSKSSKLAKEIFENHLINMGFKKSSEYEYGEYVDKLSLKIPGGNDYSNTIFQFEKDNYSGNQIKLVFKISGVKDPINAMYSGSGFNNSPEITDLNRINFWKTEFERNPSKALDKLEEFATTNGKSYLLNHIKDLKSNFYTGKKKKGDVATLSPKDILEKFKIPNVSITVVQGKRSSVFDRETSLLSDNLNFFKNFKNYYEKYGAPIKIETKTFDNSDSEDVAYARRAESEWSYSKGTNVIVHFKDKDGKIVSLYN
ncbi:hypothetical protein M0Q97_13710 [Candidatus Dojkabacteria bacterium]|jgi:hypothetical protein|nr:hypothetical protein [Candidatus Dojkabacteria bacterium]